MRELHQKVGALISVVFVFFSGTAIRGDRTMNNNPKRSRPAVPRVYTTRSGSRYVRSIDVIRSEAGRKEITLQMKSKDEKRPSSSDGTTSSHKSKS